MNINIKNSLGFKINQLANKLNQSFTKELNPYDIAPEQRATLDIINENKLISQKELSLILQKDKTTVSRSLSALEKKGYITKEESEEDKRISTIVLSKKGKQILEETQKSANIFRKKINNSLSKEELEVFQTLVNKIDTSIEDLV